MKEYLYVPKIKIDMPLAQIKKLVFSLFKKIKGVTNVSTYILKKCYPDFRASVAQSWFNILATLMYRDKNLDKDLTAIRVDRFPIILKVLRKHNILKSKEHFILGYAVDLSLYSENRKGDASYTKLGTIGYCTLRCRWTYSFMTNTVYFLTANDMVKHVITMKKRFII